MARVSDMCVTRLGFCGAECPVIWGMPIKQSFPSSVVRLLVGAELHLPAPSLCAVVAW